MFKIKFAEVSPVQGTFDVKVMRREYYKTFSSRADAAKETYSLNQFFPTRYYIVKAA